jgi:hypothetical protein
MPPSRPIGRTDVAPARFAYPLKKRTDFSIKGFLSPQGMSEVADNYRKRFGGPFFPCSQNPKPVPPCDVCGAEYIAGKGYERCNGSCWYG